MKLLVIAALVSPAMVAQSPTAKFTFEVASVKAVGDKPEAGGGGSGAAVKTTGMPPALAGDPIHINYSGVNLLGVLCRAYDLQPRLIEAPDWMRQDRYNITAKVPDDAPKGHIAQMLQNLLIDRFHMVVHWETREESGFALTVGKNGPKIKKSETNENGEPLKHTIMFGGSGHLAWTGTTMDQLANSLSIDLGRPVVNQTGVTGVFDIAFEASPDSLPGLPSFGSHSDSPLPSIFTAIHEVGLNLEPQKVSQRHLVVDSAQKLPTEN